MNKIPNNVMPLRRLRPAGEVAQGHAAAQGRAVAQGPAAAQGHAVNIDRLRDLRALVECACWLAEQGYSVQSAAVAHGTLVLRGENHGVEIRRPLRGAAVTVAWRPGIERRLEGGNIGRRTGAHGPVYIWQAEHKGVRIYWTTKEGQACV